MSGDARERKGGAAGIRDQNTGQRPSKGLVIRPSRK
jgi:hypothetical protein